MYSTPKIEPPEDLEYIKIEYMNENQNPYSEG